MTRTRRFGILATSVALLAGSFALAAPATAAPSWPVTIESVPTESIDVNTNESFIATYQWKITEGTADILFHTRYYSPEQFMSASTVDDALTITSVDGSTTVVPVTCWVDNRYEYFNVSCQASASVTVTAGDVVAMSQSVMFSKEAAPRAQTLSTVLLSFGGGSPSIGAPVHPNVSASVTALIDSVPVPMIDPVVGGATVLGLGLLAAGAVFVIRRRKATVSR